MQSRLKAFKIDFATCLSLAVAEAATQALGLGFTAA